MFVAYLLIVVYNMFNRNLLSKVLFITYFLKQRLQNFALNFPALICITQKASKQTFICYPTIEMINLIDTLWIYGRLWALCVVWTRDKLILIN